MTARTELPEGIVDYLDAVAAMRAHGETAPDRQRLIADREAWRLAMPRPEGMAVTDTHVVADGAETPVRIYRPAGSDEGEGGGGGALVYFHGGGFVAGSIETFDPLAMGLAEASGLMVISVGYRRLPEASPRAIVTEGAEVFAWAQRNAALLGIDAEAIGLAGDSAGAFIAATLALGPLRDHSVACLALMYGLFDCDPASLGDTSGADDVLPMAVVTSILATFAECDARDPLPDPAPLCALDLAALPPTVLLHAEGCPFLTQGRAFAARLAEAGVVLREQVSPGMPHGFLRALRFSAPARHEMAMLGAAIREIHPSGRT